MTDQAFIDRLQMAACPYIDLAEDEKDIYHGAGWALATVEAGRVTALEYLNRLPDGTDPEPIVNAALAAGNRWLVMASCWQLCEPRRIHLGDATGIARLARLIVTGDDE
jgi:hypothetical protein